MILCFTTWFEKRKLCIATLYTKLLEIWPSKAFSFKLLLLLAIPTSLVCFTGTPFHCLTCFLLFEAIFCLIHTSRLVFPSLSLLSFITSISCFSQTCMRVKTKIGTTTHFTTLISLLYTNLRIFIIQPISYLSWWFIFTSTFGFKYELLIIHTFIIYSLENFRWFGTENLIITSNLYSISWCT